MTERSQGFSGFAVALCWAQGLYFLATGVWPLVSVDTFQAVTGQKTDHLIAEAPSKVDHWMLYTISVLIIAIAVVLVAAAWRRRPSFDVALLGVLSAIGLTIIDVVYVARGTIWPIYLADAAAEVVIIFAWSWTFARGGLR
jgi:small-conductance mechanosensitive channel